MLEYVQEVFRNKLETLFKEINQTGKGRGHLIKSRGTINWECWKNLIQQPVKISYHRLCISLKFKQFLNLTCWWHTSCIEV